MAAAVLAGLLTLSVIAINLIPGAQYKPLVSTIVKSSTGREFTIGGDFDVRLFSTLTFKASNVKFANAQWGSRPQMLSIDEIEGKVALFPLLKGVLDLALTVEKPALLLETHNSGQANWQFGELAKEAEKPTEPVKKAPAAKPAPESAGGMPLRLRIRKLHIEGARIVYRNDKTGDQLVLQGKELHVEPAGGKLTVAFKGRLNDLPLALSGDFDDAEFLVGNQPAGVKFDGHCGDIQFTVQGTAGPLAPTYDLDVALALKSDSVAAFAPLARRNLPDLGPLSVAARVTGRKGKYAVSDFTARLDDKRLTALVTGAMADLAALDGLDMTVKVDTGRLSRILEQIGYPSAYKLPDALHAMAVLKGGLNNLAIKQFKAKIQGQGINVAANGATQNIMALESVWVDVFLQAESLDLLSQIVQTPLPPLAPIKAHIRLKSKDRNLGNMQIKANLEGRHLHANAAGSLENPLKFRGLRADINLDMSSFAWLSEYIKIKLPSLGPLKASVGIASKGETLEVRNIQAHLAGQKIQARIVGSIKDALKPAGITADIRFGVDSLTSLDSLLKRRLPDSGPVSLEARISGEGGFKEPMDISAMLKSDGVTANLSGTIAAPLAARGIDVTLTAEAESLQKVGKLTGVQLQGREPLRSEGKFTTTGKVYELADLHLQVGELDVKGQAAFKPPSGPGGRPQISGKLQAGRLDLNKWLMEAKTAPETKNSPVDKEKAPTVQPDRVFSTAALPFGPLRAVDAALQVTLASLTTHLLQLSDMNAHLMLTNGLLNLKPFKARVGKGVFNGRLMLNMRSRPATLTANMEITDATVRNFGGRLHLFANLDGNGDSIAAIMAGLNGQFEVDVRDATLKTSFMTNFGSGLFKSLNPFAKDEGETKLICGAILFDIKDGIADANNKLALQMADVTWFGSGEINLKTEKIDFGMSPVPRSGTGIHLGAFAKLAHIGGTLGRPKIELDPKDIATKYGKYAAAMATGGLSLLAERVWGVHRANSDVCGKILKGLESKSRKPDGEIQKSGTKSMHKGVEQKP